MTVPISPADLAALSARVSQLPAMLQMGATADFTDPEAVRVRIARLEPYHRGGMGTEAVNGAVIAALCDAAVGFAGTLRTLGRRAGTAQLSIQYLRPVHGGSVEAVGRVVRAGPNLVFATAEVRDEDGVLCARCDGIVAVSQGKPGEMAF